jgi:predicted ATPase
VIKSQEALSLAQEVSHVYSLAFALHFATLLHQSRREVQFVQERAESTIALSSEHGFIFTLGGGVRMRGWALVEQGLAEKGIEQICQGLAIWRAQGSNLGLTQLLGLLGEAYGKSGQTVEGLKVLTEALIAVEEHSEHHYEAELYRLKGELHL